MDQGNWYTFLKYLGLVVGCIAKFTSGSLFVFSAYQNAIKETFNYTQTEVELLSSCLNLGLGTGFLPGMIFDKFGPHLTSGIGLIISGGSYFLIWSTTKSVKFYEPRSGLMAFYFYLAGFGSLFSYMAALNTNAINFPAKHRGKVISLLNAFFTGSPSVFVSIYYNVFSDGDYNIVKNQHYDKLMFFFAILFIVMNAMCIVCLHDLSKLQGPETKSAYTVENSTDSNHVQSGMDSAVNSIEGSKKNTEERKDDSIKFILLLKDPSFHLLAYTFMSAAILSLVNTNNLTVLTKSVGLNHFDNTLLLVMPIVNTIISFLIGPVSDKIKGKIPRLTLLVIGCVFFTASELVYVFFGTYLAGVICSVIITAFGIGTLWSLVPTIVSEMFGIRDFGRNWGLLLMLAGVAGLGGQAIFGFLYDSRVRSDNIYCYGKDCTIYGYILMAVLGLISIALSAILDIRQRYREKYNQIL
ncbi:hypothetical protein LOTGIDRAFT_230330 [Lottia gigantea]|uniref:Major facilitator superfamily (MFS) profile domain-containing protein n=1 Tax=Lottia gigantea TaxID=225164 RepID=V4AFH3_LOTGI|nr:hypothetical protein LOTGIDRAFT_230330 [Lottia gigantea]ESP02784.1 hypothetical protein LOTGIDRAFT_230330 [Lottia gigantea]